jgi:hypothetical protein
VVVACMGFVLAGAAGGARPLTVYNSLVVSPYGNAELPAGFSRAEVVPATVTAGARSSQRVVGALQFVLAGPDPNDEIMYAVYATPTAARHAFEHAVSANSGFHVRFAGRVRGVAGRSAMYVGTGRNASGAAFGVSIAGALERNVVVSVMTSARAQKRGNTPGTRALLRSGVRHLAGVLGTTA